MVNLLRMLILVIFIVGASYHHMVENQVSVFTSEMLVMHCKLCLGLSAAPQSGSSGDPVRLNVRYITKNHFSTKSPIVLTD